MSDIVPVQPSVRPAQFSVSRPLTSTKSQPECYIVKDEVEFRALEPEWNELWKSSQKAAFFQTYTFCLHSWNQINKPAKQSLFCITVRENAKLVLIWPLVISRRGPFTIVKPLGQNSAEAADMLYDPATNVARNARLAWDTVMTHRGFDVLNLPFVKTNSELYAVIPKSYKSIPDVSPYADFRDQTNWEEYCRLIGTNSHQQLKRKRKRLSEMGTLQFQPIKTLEQPERSAELITWMMNQKQYWGKRTGKNGPWLSSTRYLNFLIKLVTDPSNVQNYILYTLFIDGKPLAAKLFAIGASHADLFIAGYHANPEYGKWSPGLILDDFWMQEMFERRLNVDFGTGGDRYKLFWARNNKHDKASYRIPLSIFGNIVIRSLELKDKIQIHLHNLRKRFSTLFSIS